MEECSESENEAIVSPTKKLFLDNIKSFQNLNRLENFKQSIKSLSHIMRNIFKWSADQIPLRHQLAGNEFQRQLDLAH